MTDIARSETNGLLLEPDTFRPMIVGIEGYKQDPLFIGLECL